MQNSAMLWIYNTCLQSNDVELYFKILCDIMKSLQPVYSVIRCWWSSVANCAHAAVCWCCPMSSTHRTFNDAPVTRQASLLLPTKKPRLL